MNKTQIQFAVAILLTAVISFFLGRLSNSGAGTGPIAEKVEKKAEEKKVAEDTQPPAQFPTGEEPPKEDTETAPADESDSTPESNIEVEPPSSSPAPSTTTAAAGAAVLGRLNTGISDSKISSVLEAISKNMEAKRLAYISSKLQDCSGIFHQLKDSIQARLPVLKSSASYIYPGVTEARSSRQIADWYHQKGNLLIVKDPRASKNSIRPGSVMFFGQSGKIFTDLSIEALTDKNNNYTKNGAIQHIAVVTSVKTDAHGNVEEYTMMHARYPGGPHASRSGSKEVQSNSARNKAKVAPYPFGHWTQQWVAVANIMTSAK